MSILVTSLTHHSFLCFSFRLQDLLSTHKFRATNNFLFVCESGNKYKMQPFCWFRGQSQYWAIFTIHLLQASWFVKTFKLSKIFLFIFMQKFHPPWHRRLIKEASIKYLYRNTFIFLLSISTLVDLKNFEK